ncbi:hypothetical protein [Chamaesiphon sp. GL140_3_metabinner_50]|uniref:hypothetical protein n=1 Tax=Chamaesiphon sp. GL140_3_metabinner_50 TaxID=2970812 RepID=UPI0025E28BDD|nr:hypothetical protein [Chamaesiphon sp. GL140_3_metabinner_50]
MNISQIENIKYITNDRGDKIEAVIPIDLWYELLGKIPPTELSERDESGVDPIDENEPKSQILADLRESIRAVKTGDVYPVSQLWNDLDS